MSTTSNTSPISYTTRDGDAYAILSDGSERLVYKSLATSEQATHDDACWTEPTDDTPVYEPVTRILGPIPSGPDIEPSADGDMWQHPGGRRPAWGGYAPIAVDEAGEQALREQRPDVVRLVAGDFSGVYTAHTTGTILMERAGAWYVLCPERPSRRAVVIACNALRERGPGVLAHLIGLRPDEAEAAEKLHAERQGSRAYCAPLPWEPVQQYAPVAKTEEIEIIRRPTQEGDEE